MALKEPIASLTALTLAACAGTADVDQPRPMQVALEPGDPTRGAVLGRKLCTSCHGADGRGRGEAAEGLDPPPRDFVRAVYRYRSTPTGSLPTDADLARSIIVGLPGTSMAGFGDLLSAQDVRDLVAWVKAFSPRFSIEEIDDPIEIPSPPAMTAATIERGREVYAEMQCGKCHGEDGSGSGWASKDDLRGPLGQYFNPRDFREGIYRSGIHQRDLYRTVVTGLDGTPMAAYEDTLPPEDVYSLVHYLLDLERGRGPWFWLTHAPRWYEPTQISVRR